MTLGKNLTISIDNKCIGASTECSLDFSHSPVETIPSTNWRYRTYTEGKREWTITASGFVFADYDRYNPCVSESILAIGTKVTCDLDINLEQSLTGEAYIKSIKINARNKNMATYSIQLVGSGPLTE